MESHPKEPTSFIILCVCMAPSPMQMGSTGAFSVPLKLEGLHDGLGISRVLGKPETNIILVGKICTDTTQF